jgi:hypothetical protein
MGALIPMTELRENGILERFRAALIQTECTLFRHSISFTTQSRSSNCFAALVTLHSHRSELPSRRCKRGLFRSGRRGYA